MRVHLGCDHAGLDLKDHLTAWLTEHGPSFGWFNPPWAQSGGSRPEPWHWEFGDL